MEKIYVNVHKYGNISSASIPVALCEASSKKFINKGDNLVLVGFGGGKCLRALKEHVGGFSLYPKDQNLELVGYSYCGGCPGGNIEYVPEEMIKNGAEVKLRE